MVQGKLTWLAGLNVMDTMVGPSCLGHTTALGLFCLGLILLATKHCAYEGATPVSSRGN